MQARLLHWASPIWQVCFIAHRTHSKCSQLKCSQCSQLQGSLKILSLHRSANICIFIYLKNLHSLGCLFGPNSLTSSQLACQLTIGRALHRYCRGHGFKSCTGLKFFSGPINNYSFQQCSQLQGSLKILSLHRSANICIFIYLKNLHSK